MCYNYGKAVTFLMRSENLPYPSSKLVLARNRNGVPGKTEVIFTLSSAMSMSHFLPALNVCRTGESYPK